MNILNTYGRDLGPIALKNEKVILLAVLTQGDVDDYAVYEGIVPAEQPRNEAAADVARHGAKCNYKRALTYFPNLPADNYRA